VAGWVDDSSGGVVFVFGGQGVAGWEQRSVAQKSP